MLYIATIDKSRKTPLIRSMHLFEMMKVFFLITNTWLDQDDAAVLVEATSPHYHSYFQMLR